MLVPLSGSPLVVAISTRDLRLGDSYASAQPLICQDFLNLGHSPTTTSVVVSIVPRPNIPCSAFLAYKSSDVIVCSGGIIFQGPGAGQS